MVNNDLDAKSPENRPNLGTIRKVTEMVGCRRKEGSQIPQISTYPAPQKETPGLGPNTTMLGLGTHLAVGQAL